MGFVDFGRAYKRTHPHASKSLIRKKYTRATFVMFGKKTRRERADHARSSPTLPPALLPAPRPRKSSTMVSVRMDAIRAEPIVLPLERDLAPARAGSGVGGGGALDRLDSSYVPADDLIEFHDRNDLVDITSIHKCKLPEWMKATLAKLPKPAGWIPPHPVYIIPRTIEYIFGVCGTVEEKIMQVLRAIKDTRELSSIFQGMFLFEMKPGKQTLKKDANLSKDFKKFIDGPSLFAYVHFKSTTWYHARALFKDSKTKTVFVIDPLGKNSSTHDPVFLPAVNKLLKGCKNPNYTKVEFKKGRQDQRNEQRSCGAVSFTRMVYAAYKTHKNPGTAPMDYIYQALPCRYAIFVSELFQRVDIITRDTHAEVVATLSRKLLADRIRDRRIQEEERKVEELRQRVLRRQEEEEETKDDVS